jgi:hypothetical protein
MSDRQAIIAALRILQDRSIGSPEACGRAQDVLSGALSAGPGCKVCGDERILMEPDGSKAQPCFACTPPGTTLEQASRVADPDEKAAAGGRVMPGVTRVQGHCPACGSASLFLGDGGYVTCGRLDCSCRSAASDILAERETEHVVVFKAGSFTVKHPLRERINDELLTCELHAYISRLDGPPTMPGVYRAVMGETRWMFYPVAEPESDAA